MFTVSIIRGLLKAPAATTTSACSISKYFGRVVGKSDGYTTELLDYHKLGGRDENGRRVVRYGGGRKVWFRWVDKYRHPDVLTQPLHDETGRRILGTPPPRSRLEELVQDDTPILERARNDPQPLVTRNKDGDLIEVVLQIRSDHLNSAYLALVASGRHQRWIWATEGMKPGRLITTSTRIGRFDIVAEEGDAYPVGALAMNSVVCQVETVPGEGAHYAKEAGGCCHIVRRVGDKTVLRHKMGQIMVDNRCMAVIGRMSNAERSRTHWDNINEKRYAGIKQRSGLFQKKTGYHGRKIKPEKKMRVYEARMRGDKVGCKPLAWV